MLPLFTYSIYIYMCIYNRLGWASESQHKLLFIRIEL